MRKEGNILNQIDWVAIIVYLLLAVAGWLNIYAAEYNELAIHSPFDIAHSAGRQFLWILCSFGLIIVIIIIDFRFYEPSSFLFYGLVMLMLVAVLFIGQEIAGSRSWFGVGSFRIQPSEFAKFATSLAVARYLAINNKFRKLEVKIGTGAIILIPVALIILQGDTGTALIFSAFILVLFREGLSGWILVVGFLAIIIFILTLMVDKYYLIAAISLSAVAIIYFIRKNIKRIGMTIAITLVVIGTVLSVDYFFTNVLKPHQQNRIKAFIDPEADPKGYGYNVIQSKIAIGSGGFYGKGYLQGTQTKGDFVPEQTTDFIFCTIGEEHGWLGSLFVISLYVTLMLRLVFLAERQKSTFSRVYGYSVACILFIHFLVNIGMTTGLFPVIGIPLPFFSYGGSSLWGFTILLFIFLKLDAHRMQVLERN